MAKPNIIKRYSQPKKYRKVFWVSSEGSVSEREYLLGINFLNKNCLLKFVPHNNKKSAPFYKLKTIKNFITTKQTEIRENDEFWIVLDKDDWPESSLSQLIEWANSDKNRYFVGFSNPLFELWLLMHFDQCSPVPNTGSLCKEKLKKYIPDYDKHIDFKMLEKNIDKAIARAKQIGVNGFSRDCFSKPGSTLYLLIERFKSYPNNI